MPNIQAERLRHLAIKPEEWELASGRLPASAPLEPGGRPEPFVACVCVSKTGAMGMADPQPERLLAPSLGVDAFTSLAPQGTLFVQINSLPTRSGSFTWPQRLKNSQI